METANTNRTSSDTSGTGGTGSTGTGTTAGTNAGGSGSMGAPPAAPAGATAEKAGEQKFYVDGRAVSREEWRKAAGENGYDLSRMPDNFFPAISTRKHGE